MDTLRPGKRLNVLLIDEDPLVLRALERALSLRHDVTAVANSDDVAPILDTAQPFDAVLCDFNVWADEGVGLSAALLRRWPNLAARMAIMTGDPSDARVKAFARDKNVRLIGKPIGVGALLDHVDQLAARASADSENGGISIVR